MFFRLGLQVGARSLRAAAPYALSTGATLALASNGHAECGWFGKSAEEKRAIADDEQKARDLAEMKASLGTWASSRISDNSLLYAFSAKRAVEEVASSGKRSVEEFADDLKNHKGDATLHTMGHKLAELQAKGVPFDKISYGFAAGFCTGYAGKKASKLLAIVGGAGFFLVQYLAYHNLITIDHEAMEEKFNAHFDVNKDGKVDGADAKTMFDDWKEIASFSMPQGGGFAAGLFAGLKAG